MVKLPFYSFKINGRSRPGYEVYSGGKSDCPEEFRSLPQIRRPEEMIFIALYLGERPTGGYQIKPVEVRLEESRLRIRYKEEKPSPSTMSPAFSYPALLLAGEEFLPSGLEVILEPTWKMAAAALIRF